MRSRKSVSLTRWPLRVQQHTLAVARMSVSLTRWQVSVSDTQVSVSDTLAVCPTQCLSLTHKHTQRERTDKKSTNRGHAGR